MNPASCLALLCSSLLWLTEAVTSLGAAPSDSSPPPRPRLQFINGSAQPMDIFWLKTGAERVPNGSVAPGEDTILQTTIGHLNGYDPASAPRFVWPDRLQEAKAQIRARAEAGDRKGRQASGKPVLLYSRHFNAEGETRYLPDGTYRKVLQRLRSQFEVRVSREALTDTGLAGVKVLLVANPSDLAVGDHPAPPHFSGADIAVLTRFVDRGGGLIMMGNQENHNLEVEDTNQLLAGFGLAFTNLYTDVKSLALPSGTPVIGGLSWAYYTGNLLVVNPNHPARPRPLVLNDTSQKPLNGPRNQAGALLAVAEPGRGRVVAVTDAGWITNDVLDGKGIGGVVIKDHDNWEIFRRLAGWAAGLDEPDL